VSSWEEEEKHLGKGRGWMERKLNGNRILTRSV
jgi:hypothetical protein